MHLLRAGSILVPLLAGCAAPQPRLGPSQACVQFGLASWYRVARPEGNFLTAAHRTLPMGTQVRVTDLETGRSVVVQVRDRGPFIKGRIIDLSAKAATELGIRHDGVSSVRVEPLRTQVGAAESADTALAACPFRQPDRA